MCWLELGKSCLGEAWATRVYSWVHKLYLTLCLAIRTYSLFSLRNYKSTFSLRWPIFIEGGTNLRAKAETLARPGVLDCNQRR